MASKILERLAIAAGTGLGRGLSSSRKRPQEANSDDAVTVQSVLDRLDRLESRMAAAEARFLPAIDLESIIEPRIEALRILLLRETEERVDETLAAFERTIGDAVSNRISILEKALIDQSAIITTLSHRAIESDGNLQRLIAAVERLCKPFHSQLDDAMQRPPDPGFRPRIITQPEEDAARRHRVPLTRF
jgi:uncharacterized coiled-coil protein SlyX